MVDAQTLSIVFAGLSIGLAAIYYMMTLRNSQKAQQLQLETRQAQLFMQLNDRMTDEFNAAFLEINERWNWTDFDDFMRKFGPEENPEEWRKLGQVFVLYEQMGILVRDGLISSELLWLWGGGYPIRLYEKFSSVIDEYRLQYEAPPKGMWFEWFEDLTYALREEREKDRRDFANRLARRKRQREAFGI